MSRTLSISIAMCTYNGERYLQEQLDSLLWQSRLPDELVICDDASRDNTVPLLEAFAHRAPFPVRLIINPQNLGYVKNFEKAISLCQGDIIFLSDQDDVWLPEKLALMEREFALNPQIESAMCDFTLVDENLEALYRSYWAASGFGPERQRQFSQGQALPLFLKNCYPRLGCASAFRQHLRELCLPIPSLWGYDRWIRLIMCIRGKTALVRDQLIKYRQHPRQLFGASAGSFRQKFTRASILSKDYYRQEALRWEQAILCLTANNGVQADAQSLDLLAAKARHYKVRAQLPPSILKRLPWVLAEILRRGYKYSRGWRSAIKDLFIPSLGEQGQDTGLERN